jgi:hypothetical protein
VASTNIQQPHSCYISRNIPLRPWGASSLIMRSCCSCAVWNGNQAAARRPRLLRQCGTWRGVVNHGECGRRNRQADESQQLCANVAPAAQIAKQATCARGMPPSITEMSDSVEWVARHFINAGSSPDLNRIKHAPLIQNILRSTFCDPSGNPAHLHAVLVSAMRFSRLVHLFCAPCITCRIFMMINLGCQSAF